MSRAKFNLNTLLKKDGTPNQDAMKVLRRLLELLEMDPRWASLLIDWMDPNGQPEADGGEDSLYPSQTPPHRTGNLLLTSVSELQQLPGFNRELYLKLLPHVTALPPEARTINVCTADGVVLDALYAVSKNPQLKKYLSGVGPRFQRAAEEERIDRRVRRKRRQSRLASPPRIEAEVALLAPRSPCAMRTQVIEISYCCRESIDLE